MPRKKLVYETCRFPSKERHKGVKQEELADLSFEPCGKILVTSGRGTINRSRKRTPPLNLSASLPHRASDRVRRGTLAKMCARTAAAVRAMMMMMDSRMIPDAVTDSSKRERRLTKAMQKKTRTDSDKHDSATMSQDEPSLAHFHKSSSAGKCEGSNLPQSGGYKDVGTVTFASGSSQDRMSCILQHPLQSVAKSLLLLTMQNWFDREPVIKKHSVMNARHQSMRRKEHFLLSALVPVASSPHAEMHSRMDHGFECLDIDISAKSPISMSWAPLRAAGSSVAPIVDKLSEAVNARRWENACRKLCKSELPSFSTDTSQAPVKMLSALNQSAKCSYQNWLGQLSSWVLCKAVFTEAESAEGLASGQGRGSNWGRSESSEGRGYIYCQGKDRVPQNKGVAKLASLPLDVFFFAEVSQSAIGCHGSPLRMLTVAAHDTRQCTISFPHSDRQPYLGKEHFTFCQEIKTAACHRPRIKVPFLAALGSVCSRKEDNFLGVHVVPCYVG
ncbi:hypothetical protein Anapl_01168 [Anas platyrhynchos]|uniref:Uncharacterized protein n=1 Tax=Anas platyrhynchos TaxID=8839 RepID=R0LZH5_ANAPL|nr:hypothetical protein Anapl_01168 [Anas platyrhynchos]